MSEIVADTGVVSFLFKNHPIGRLYDPDLTGHVALISSMTVAEMERWAIQYGWGKHRLRWLHLYLNRFTVVPSSPDLCRKWAEVMAASQAAGRRMECATPGLPQPPCCTARRSSRTIEGTISVFPDCLSFLTRRSAWLSTHPLSYRHLESDAASRD